MLSDCLWERSQPTPDVWEIFVHPTVNTDLMWQKSWNLQYLCNCMHTTVLLDVLVARNIAKWHAYVFSTIDWMWTEHIHLSGGNTPQHHPFLQKSNLATRLKSLNPLVSDPFSSLDLNWFVCTSRPRLCA